MVGHRMTASGFPVRGSDANTSTQCTVASAVGVASMAVVSPLVTSNAVITITGHREAEV